MRGQRKQLWFFAAQAAKNERVGEADQKDEEYKLGLEQTSQVNTYSSGATFTFELYMNVHTFRYFLYELRFFLFVP